ncbi:MAG: YqgE/AlgH family protein [Actinomycetota bacterium]
MADASLGGRLLVATPLLGDPSFRRTVVLIIDDRHAEGTIGVVVNRPSEVPVSQVLPSWAEVVTGPPVVFTGGPVSTDSALALALAGGDGHPVGWRSLDSAPVMRRVGLVDLEAPPELLARGITSFRVFAGYAGWGPGQLQAEIDEGSWYVLRGEPADAFSTDPGRLWRAVLRRQGGEIAMVATFPDDPACN